MRRSILLRQRNPRAGEDRNALSFSPRVADGV